MQIFRICLPHVRVIRINGVNAYFRFTAAAELASQGCQAFPERKSLTVQPTHTNDTRMAAPLKTTKEWAALAAHYKEVEELHMRRLFEEGPGRFEQFR